MHLTGETCAPKPTSLLGTVFIVRLAAHEGSIERMSVQRGFCAKPDQEQMYFAANPRHRRPGEDLSCNLGAEGKRGHERNMMKLDF